MPKKAVPGKQGDKQMPKQATPGKPRPKEDPLIEKRYEVVGPRKVAEKSKGEEVCLTLTEAAEKCLIDCGHVKPKSEKEEPEPKPALIKDSELAAADDRFKSASNKTGRPWPYDNA